MKKFLPLVPALAAVLAPVVAPPVQEYIASNPTLTAGLGAAAYVLGYLLQSPIKRA